MEDERNIVIIDGVDMYEAFGMVLEDGYVISIPDYKRFTIDLLGDGVIDLTEASGDIYFEEREISLPMFANRQHTTVEFESLKSQLASWVNGRKVKIRFAFDPDFTYEGRVKAVEFEHKADVPHVLMQISAKPYKTKGYVTFTANAAGGIQLRLDNGRARTQPTLEIYNKAIMSYEGNHWELEAGTWEIDNFWLHGGENLISITTTPDYCMATVDEYAEAVLSSLASKMLCELAQGDSPLQSPMTLQETDAKCKEMIVAVGTAEGGDIGGSLFAIESVRLIDLAHPVSEDSEEFGNTNVYFHYEWRDL